MSKTIQKLARMGILTAISVLLMYLIRIPMFLPFLEYDPADIPILVGALIYGPGAGLMLTVAVSLLQWLTVSQNSQVWGFIMHVCATGTMVLVMSLIYFTMKLQLSRVRHTIGGSTLMLSYRRIVGRGGIPRMALALAAGGLSRAVMMIPLNLLITPIYTKAPLQAVIDLLLPAIIPFNLVVAGINCAVTFVIYSSVGRFIAPRDTYR